MNKRKFNELTKQQYVFKMKDFFQKYYQYDIHHINVGITLEASIHEIQAFQTFIDNTDFTDKSHHSLLIYRTKMERLLNQSEEPEYYHYIKVFTEKYQEEWESVLEKDATYCLEINELRKQIHAISKHRSFYKKLSKDTQNHLNGLRHQQRNLDQFIEKDKRMLGYIRSSLEELLRQQEPLQQKLDELLHKKQFNDLQIEVIRKNKKAFESRLYVLEHKNIINNVVNNIYPLEIEEIDRNMVFSGLALLVQDKNGIILPYANPYCLEQVEWYYHNMLGEDIREVLWEEKPRRKVLKREEDK